MALAAPRGYINVMAIPQTEASRRLLAIALAAGLSFAPGVAGARDRSTTGEAAKPEPSDVLRKRLADQRYFDIVQNSLRTSPPPPVPMVIPPRIR